MKIPRLEHPNPQFCRKNWINLNGEWEFELDNSVSGLDRELYKKHLADKIIVPFCPESKLSGIEHTDFINACWYRREFTPPEGRVILHFGAVDYYARVYINGSFAFEHSGGYSSFSSDITRFVTRDSVNTLCVYVRDDVRDSIQARGKQSEKYRSNECDYTRTTGIWQTVWLEGVAESYIQSVELRTYIATQSVNISARIHGGGKLVARAFYEGRLVGEASAQCAGSANLTLELSELHLWEVGKGRLYDLQLELGEDSVSSYFGMREVHLEGKKFMLNNKSVFQRTVLDQGYYPEGLYTAPTESDMERDIQISLDAGFNGARLHQKVFEPRFLYHCDKAGYLVWGEFGSWGVDMGDARVLKRIIPEWLEIVRRDFNHPSIIGWCPLNEVRPLAPYLQPDDELTRTVYLVAKALDETRPCIDTSGYTHIETDIFDIHDYDGNVESFRNRYITRKAYDEMNNYGATYGGEPVFMSEYGGILWQTLPDSGAWGYGDKPDSKEEFLDRYKGLTDAILDSDMFGFCYTQLYDIEQEQNGLYTYERVPKFDMNVIKSINSRRAKLED